MSGGEAGVYTTAYLLSGVLFIRSLGGLSRQDTARRGNRFGIAGMVLAILTTLSVWASNKGVPPLGLGVMIGAIGIGASVGAVLARRVEMTGMPELVAMLHSFVGVAAVMVGISSYVAPTEHIKPGMELLIHLLEISVGVGVGAVTFTGSVVAWGKLRGTFSGRPLLLPGRHLLNLGLALAMAACIVPFAQADGSAGLPWLLAITAMAGVLGAHLVLAIGGADMPVVVSLLNSYSGWAAAAAGFVLGNDLLIVTGALVGSSGAILSIIMCRAMNRSILNVVFGGFGTESGATSAAPVEGEVVAMEAAEVAAAVAGAKEVVIVPGYGMAVARAQASVWELTRTLRERGIKVRFAIHPVAGRLPGHMNVLLAEAGVPYDLVLEMEDINPDMDRTDVVLVLGANDIVNPGALTDASSPIYGMPVIEVWKAKLVVVSKRGMAAGYAGVENPLFYLDNTRMLFGDARKSVDAVIQALKAG